MTDGLFFRMRIAMKMCKNIIFGYLVMAASVAAQMPLEGLSWLSGCWRADLEGTVLEEHWSTPVGGTMVGFSRAVEQDETVFIEFSSIARTEEGVFYTAFIIAGNQITPFKMVALDSSEVIFTNPDHDFPQTITYQRLSAEELLIRLQGVENGQEKEESYAMKRENCP